MVNQQLLDYIKQQLQQGVSKEFISSSLLAQGWQMSDVEEAFNLINYSNPSVPPENTSSQSFSRLPQQPVKTGLSKPLLSAVSIIGVLIIGGGVFGYFYYFQESPEKVIQKMSARLVEVKSLEYSGEVKAEITALDLLGGNGNFLQPTQPIPSQQTSNFSINFSGKSDIGDLNNPRGYFAFNIKTDALKELTQGESIFDLEIRTIGKTVYLKLNNIPNLGLFDLSFIANQWIKTDAEGLEKQFLTFKEQSGLEEFEEQIKEAQKQQKLSPAQIEELKRVVSSAKIFKITDKLSGEKIEGVKTHHYKFIIDKGELKKLIIDIGVVIQDETLTEEELAGLDKSLEAIESTDGEIWIGRKDFLPYKASLTLKIKKTGESETTGKLTATISFKNYNKPVQIDIPSPVKNLEEILGGLFGGFFGGMQLKGLQQDIQLPEGLQQDIQLPEGLQQDIQLPEEW